MAARRCTSNCIMVYQWPRCGCGWTPDTHPLSEYQSNRDTYRFNWPGSREIGGCPPSNLLSERLTVARRCTRNRSAVYQWPRCGCGWTPDTHPLSEYQSNGIPIASTCQSLMKSVGVLPVPFQYPSSTLVYQWPRCGCGWAPDTHPLSEYQSSRDTHRFSLPEFHEIDGRSLPVLSRDRTYSAFAGKGSEA
jgi:hypothetical protein